MVKTPSGMTPEQARIQRERTQAFRDRAKPITPGIDPTTNRPNTTVTGGVPIPVTRTVAPVVTPKAKTTNSNEVTYMIGGRPRTFDSRSAEAQGYAQDSKYETQEQYNKRKEKQKAPFTPGAEDYVQAEYNKGREAGQKFSGIFDGNVMPSSAEGELKELARKQRDERNYQAETQALQAGLNQRQLTASKRESESAQAASVAAFAQNREGAMSGTAKDVIGRYAGISGERIQTAVDQVNLADLQMKEARRQLSQAQKGESRGAIERYQGAVAAADQAIKQANIDLANAESRALSEARQFQASERQNIETFTGLLDSGVQIDLAGVLNLSSQLGVPTDLAASYYSATDQIRKDKTLSSEAKQIELNTAKQDFDDRINGFQTKEAQKIRDYERLVKQGYDPTTLAVSMDIPNDKNPVFQLELASKVALTEIDKAKASGRILDPMEQLEYAQALAEYAEMTGSGEVYLPGGTKYPIVPTGTGVSIGVKDGESGGQCGRFVNNVIGVAGFIGNSYEQKLNLINSQVPIPGMIGVSSAPGANQPFGHVFMVEKVNPDGTMDIVESNYVNKEVVGRRRVPVGMADGFIAPPNSKPTTTQGVKGLDSATIISVNQKARGTGEKKYTATEKAVLNQIDSAFADPNTDILTLLPLTAGGKDPGDAQTKKIQDYDKVLSAVGRLESTIKSSDPGGVFNAIQETILSKVPFRNKNERVKAQITALLPQVARGVYGEVGVLTDQDIDRYRQLLPSLKTTEEIQNSLISLLRTSLYESSEADLSTLARAKVDVSRFTGQIQQLRDSRESLYAEVDDDETTYLNSAPVFDNDADSIWKNIGSTFNRLF